MLSYTGADDDDEVVMVCAPHDHTPGHGYIYRYVFYVSIYTCKNTWKDNKIGSKAVTWHSYSL